MTLYKMISILTISLTVSALYLITVILSTPFDAALTDIALFTVAFASIVWIVSFLGILAISRFDTFFSRKFNIPVA